MDETWEQALRRKQREFRAVCRPGRHATLESTGARLERDVLICEAVRRGIRQVTVARVTGMDPTAIAHIVARERKARGRLSQGELLQLPAGE